jgi:hypothetical protein
MTRERALKCWPTWNGLCEVCGAPVKETEEVTRDGDFRLVHADCAVDAQDLEAR